MRNCGKSAYRQALNVIRMNQRTCGGTITTPDALQQRAQFRLPGDSSRIVTQ